MQTTHNARTIDRKIRLCLNYQLLNTSELTLTSIQYGGPQANTCLTVDILTTNNELIQLVLAQYDHSLGACNVRATVTLLIYN